MSSPSRDDNSETPIYTSLIKEVFVDYNKFLNDKSNSIGSWSYSEPTNTMYEMQLDISASERRKFAQDYLIPERVEKHFKGYNVFVEPCKLINEPVKLDFICNFIFPGLELSFMFPSGQKVSSDPSVPFDCFVFASALYVEGRDVWKEEEIKDLLLNIPGASFVTPPPVEVEPEQ